MGFPYEHSIRALTLHSGNEESAIHFLLGGSGGGGGNTSNQQGQTLHPSQVEHGYAPSAPPLTSYGYPSLNNGYPPLPPR